MLLAQLLFALNEKQNVTIRTDSMLMVNQVKGQNKVMNVRLVQYMPIVHDLTKHFSAMYLDWVPRENNE